MYQLMYNCFFKVLIFWIDFIQEKYSFFVSAVNLKISCFSPTFVIDIFKLYVPIWNKP